MGKEVWFWVTVMALAVVAVAGVKLVAAQSFAPAGLQKLGQFL